MGLAILVVGHVAVFVSVQAGANSLIFDLVLWCSPAVAAFVAAYRAPRKKILLGASMAIPAAASVVLINHAHEAQGHAVDFPGLRGGWILMKVTLEWDLMVCLVAATVGYFLSRKRTMKMASGGG